MTNKDELIKALRTIESEMLEALQGVRDECESHNSCETCHHSTYIIQKGFDNLFCKLNLKLERMAIIMNEVRREKYDR